MNNEIFSNPTIIWLLVGLVLILLELMIPGLILLFFGIGAWIVALLCLFLDLSLNWQIVIFLATSGVSLALLRKYLQAKFFKAKDGQEDGLADEFIGKTATVTAEIKPNHPGKVEFKGAPWTASSDTELKKGDTVVIVDKESITLIVKPK